MDVVAQFQSTRPMRGATKSEQSINRTARFQSTRPVWGATLRLPPEVISPSSFNPRAPCGARRTIDHIRHSLTLVSIHAPRMGRDLWGVANPRQHDRFNPRAPCGARLRDDLAGPEAFMFQSTRPMRGATCYYKQTHYAIRTFQSTRPMRGATFALYNVAPVVFVFQSTRPMRGATGDLRIPRQCRRVSIHAPHAGRDCTPYGVPGACACFNPRAPYGARRPMILHTPRRKAFQSTRPMRGATTF